MCNNKCCGCSKLLFAGTVTASTTAVTITLPAQSICNDEKLCFIVTTTIPVASPPLPVIISVGTSQYKMINQSGNFVYSDQLKSRRIYCVSLKTDSLLAKNIRCNLCPTSKDFPCIASTSPASAVVASSKGVDTK